MVEEGHEAALKRNRLLERESPKYPLQHDFVEPRVTELGQELREQRDLRRPAFARDENGCGKMLDALFAAEPSGFCDFALSVGKVRVCESNDGFLQLDDRAELVTEGGGGF